MNASISELGLHSCTVYRVSVSDLMKRLGIYELSVEQRLALIEEIWASIDATTVDAQRLSDAQRAEFELRLWNEEFDEEDIDELWEIDCLAAFSRGRH
jgi:putative addiction module component (TIGR02574 family)